MLLILDKYKSVISYLFFGVCTTLVNIIVYALCTRIGHIDIMVSTCIAWLIAVVFAYLTNRKWVFGSTAANKTAILLEIGSFFGCRIFTGVLDIVIMFIFVSRLGFPDVIMKLASNFLVIVLNYIMSKLVVFKG